jgi:hypothetical protein
MEEMFTRMVEAKDASLVDTYYDPAFVLITNGRSQDLETFRAGHERVYPTAITYRVEYDEDSWVESGDRLAGRLLRLAELTWPDWSNLAAFETYGPRTGA